MPPWSAEPSARARILVVGMALCVFPRLKCCICLLFAVGDWGDHRYRMRARPSAAGDGLSVGRYQEDKGGQRMCHAGKKRRGEVSLLRPISLRGDDIVEALTCVNSVQAMKDMIERRPAELQAEAYEKSMLAHKKRQIHEKKEREEQQRLAEIKSAEERREKERRVSALSLSVALFPSLFS